MIQRRALLDENLLWHRVLDPRTGRIERRPKVLVKWLELVLLMIAGWVLMNFGVVLQQITNQQIIR